jgi:hypothetical protein
MSSSDNVSMAENWPQLSTGQRLRLLQAAHMSLLYFPEQDAVVATLVARWPELFAGGAVTENTGTAAVPASTIDLTVDTPARQVNSQPDVLVTALGAAQREVAELQQALVSNRIIGTAIGILMAHHRVTQQQAFDQLRQHSQQSGRKLQDVAADVISTGTMPEPSAAASPQAPTTEPSTQTLGPEQPLPPPTAIT